MTDVKALKQLQSGDQSALEWFIERYSAYVGAIVGGIVSDGKVILPGFGTFETRQRSARSGRNPRTGETIKIKATKAPAFKPGKGMKEAVAKKKK